MPWCEDCSQYRTAHGLEADGSCPECGQVIGPPPKTPWHFKLLVVSIVVYLTWRAIQGIVWLVHRV